MNRVDVEQASEIARASHRAPLVDRAAGRNSFECYTAGKVTEAFKIITSGPRDEGILVHFFDGIIRRNVIAAAGEIVVEAPAEARPL